MIFATIFDLLLIGAIVWGFIHEDKIIDFEQGIVETIKNKIRRK